MNGGETKKVWGAVAIGALGFCGALFAEPVFKDTFDNGTAGWSAWSLKKQAALVADGGAGRVTVTNLLEQIAVYRYVSLEPGKRYALRYRYKTEGLVIANGGRAGPGVAFNAAGGGNGSAGRAPLDGFPVATPTTGWSPFSAEFTVPAEAVKVQICVLGTRLATGSVWIDDVTLEPVLDEVIIRRAATPPVIDGKLDDPCWKGAMPLDGFVPIHLDPVPPSASTKAYVAYDESHLYVAFANEEPAMAAVKCAATKRDGSVWDDDCNELFLVSPGGRKAQLVVNTANVQWDAELYAKMPGDPYQPNAEWNAVWRSAVLKAENGWTTEFAIPLAVFGEKLRPGAVWRINLARERMGAKVELSQWNRIDGVFNVVDKFGVLEFRSDDALLKRFVEVKIPTPFRVKRDAPQFQSLLGEQPGRYVVGSWGIMTAMPGHYPKDMQKRFTPELWQQERKNIMTELGEAGMFGPQYQYVPDHAVWTERYGMKYWLYLQKFGTDKNAVYTDNVHHRVDPVDAAYVDEVVQGTRAFFVENPRATNLLAFALFRDEPMNASPFIFSATRNPGARAMLEGVDQEVKTAFGFGRYGLPDAFALKPSEDEAFRRIAFMRWWNARFAEKTDKIGKAFREVAPGVPYLAANYNATRSVGDEDVALLAQSTDWVGNDPYPTSTMGLYGRARALYQTGFSTKYLCDISGGRPTCVTAQAFKYFGVDPTSADIREWASQALKNGGSALFWYNEGPARMLVPSAHQAMLRVSNTVRKMNRLKLPTETKTAVFFSNLSSWGNKDEAKHGWYSLYAILGEEIGSWFKFVSDTQLSLDAEILSGCRLLYVPQLNYADTATATRLQAFVEKGGTLVVFDPQFLTKNIDGTPLAAFRARLLGGEQGASRTAKELVISKAGYQGLKAGTRLALSAVAHRESAGKVMAFEISPPADASVFAQYEDGAPAAYERKVGKGRVIFFAAQPFGNSDLALKPEAWSDLFKAFAKEIEEPTGLSIWKFELPEKGDEVAVNYAVKPSQN